MKLVASSIGVALVLIYVVDLAFGLIQAMVGIED